jgi:SAM-dependent methyltransferase
MLKNETGRRQEISPQALGVYAQTEFQDVDIGEAMRQGHPWIQQGDDYIVEIVSRHARQFGETVQVLEVGSGSAILSKRIADEVENVRVIANEVEPNLVALAQRRLKETAVELFTLPFSDWTESLDIIVSWGSHHHLSNNHLEHIRRTLRSDGIFILGDEFCPDYCTSQDLDRLQRADVIYLAEGFVLTTSSEVISYQQDGRIPSESRALEWRRQRALWKWYKYVVDYALAKANMTVALAELQIARDDLTTGFAGEHKLSPLIVERDLELQGFGRLSKKMLGSPNPQLQSFFIYELAPLTGNGYA